MKRTLRRGLPIVLLAALIVAGVLLATWPWSGEEAAGEPIEHRACNLVFQVPPESSQFDIYPIAMGLFNDGKLAVVAEMKQRRVITDPNTGQFTDERPGAFIDAETGEVLSETDFTPDDEGLLEEALATIRMEPFDAATAPWPYSDATTAPVKRERIPPNNGVEIRSPDPGSGLVLSIVSGSAGLSAIDVHSCKSTMRVDLETGAILKQDIHPDDAVAFETFRAAVEAGVR